jgi:peptide/nickel transport system substrate-binding protein
VARDRRYRWRLVAAMGALALVATACGTDDNTDTTDDTTEEPTEPTDEPTDDDAAEPADEEADETEEAVDGADYCADGGEAQLVWAHEQEPPDMHLDDPNNNLSITSWIRASLWEGAYTTSAETTWIPELIESEEIEETDEGWTYTFTLREGLTWSDGEPLTAEDVQGTFEIIMEGYDPETGEGGIYLIGSREAAGYHLIDPDSWEVDGQTYSFTTEEFYSGYHGWFDAIFPTHVLTDAESTNEALPEWELDGEVLPSSGPMVWESWDRGVSTTLVRNDDYHGSHPDNPDSVNEGAACVSGVQVNYVADTDAQINALLAGEADMVMTQPQVAFGERIATDDNFEIASEPGPVYEHWGLNTHNEHLSDPDVREALAFAMDKSRVMTALYTPLFDDLLPENGLGNVYWMSNQPDYVDHAGEEGYGVGDAEAAAELLEGAGYELGDDGIYEHPERGRLSLRVGTTGGNQLRELQIQLLQEQLAATGFEIEIDNVPGAAYFSERPFSPESIECATSGGEEGDCTIWDITQFAWVGGPWPGAGHNAFLSGSGNNPYGYANEEFDAKTEECDATFDDDERADCYNELSAYVTTRTIDEDGLVVLPITQKPSFYAYSNQTMQRGAVAPDAQGAGPLTNVVDFLPAG